MTDGDEASDQQLLHEALVEADRSQETVTIKVDVSDAFFVNTAVGYSVGWMAGTHGLTRIDYDINKLTFIETVDIDEQ